MTFSLTPEYTRANYGDFADTVDRLREYADTELAQFEEANAVTAERPWSRDLLQQVWKRSRALGFYGIHLPEQYGGQGLSLVELGILKEEIAASGRLLHQSVLGNMGGPLRVGAIFDHATPSQIERYLLPVVKGDRACCFSMTEENAGSHVRAMTTEAVPDGDGWRITGKKVFSSAGPFADFSLLIARMADSDESYSAFLVDLEAPGIRVLPGAVPLSGEHIEADIELDDVRVDRDQLLGDIGQGLRIGLGRVTTNRVLHCPSTLGLARRALQLTVEFAKKREVAGGTLSSLQAIQHMIADMATDYYAARSMTYDALTALDHGQKALPEAFMCKLFVAQKSFDIADKALQIHGKAGMVQGSEVDRIWRRLRMFRMLTGSDEIQKNAIAKSLLK